MTAHVWRCAETYVSGFRRGRPCPYRATTIIATEPPRYACGYHARAYAASVVYPLFWSLALIRRWRLGNLERLAETKP